MCKAVRGRWRQNGHETLGFEGLLNPSIDHMFRIISKSYKNYFYLQKIVFVYVFYIFVFKIEANTNLKFGIYWKMLFDRNLVKHCHIWCVIDHNQSLSRKYSLFVKSTHISEMDLLSLPQSKNGFLL